MDDAEIRRIYGELLDRINELWAFAAAVQMALEKRGIPRAEIHDEFRRMLDLAAQAEQKTQEQLEAQRRLEWLDALLRNAPPTKQ